MVRYNVQFVTKEAKVHSGTRCNTTKTVDYLLRTWREIDQATAYCIVKDNLTNEKIVYTK